jgi:nitrogen fixation protein
MEELVITNQQNMSIYVGKKLVNLEVCIVKINPEALTCGKPDAGQALITQAPNIPHEFYIIRAKEG